MAKRWLAALLLLLGSTLLSAQTPTSPASALDFTTFRDRVQPLLLDKRPGLAAAHSSCRPTPPATTFT